MTPTTPSKSPVDTIREALEAVRDDMRRMGWLDNYHLLAKTLDALSSLSSLSTQPSQKVLDPIKVEDAVTGWLVKCRPDLHIPAYSEVIASLVHRIMELAPTQPSQTMMSTDYEALYELLCKGGEALGWIDHNMYPRKRNPVLIVATEDGIGIGNSSVRYANRTSVNGEGGLFRKRCEGLNLEWVAPLPSQTEGLEDLAREWVRETYGLNLAANSAISFDTAEFVKLVAAFARSLSLPRQKGEAAKG